MSIDVLKDIAFDDIGGGCAQIFAPDGTERNIGFHEVIPTEQNLVMLVLDKETKRGSQRVPQLVEIADGLVAFRIAYQLQFAAENQVVAFSLNTTNQ